jgi:transcription-repair coupling factor (superfamily II helicase)
MPMELRQEKLITQIAQRLAAQGGVVKVSGTWGSFARLLAAHISKQLQRPILYICPHIDDADNALDDLLTFGSTSLTTGGSNPFAAGIQLLPAWEGEEDIADATDEIRAERLKVVAHSNQKSGLVIAPIQAISQPVPKPSALESGSLTLETSKEKTPEDVSAWLIDNGFE